MPTTTNPNTDTTSAASKTRKNTTRKKSGSTKAAKKPNTTKTPTSEIHVAPEQRMQMVAEAAYYLAEQRGFTEGNSEQDWYRAEIQIDQLLDSVNNPDTH